MTAEAEPTRTSERILTLDIIRGIALLGIFIMNMPAFNSSYFQGVDGSHLWHAWWDRGAETARDVLFSGKFNSMFSMLFAVGFTIQLERLQRRDSEHATALYLKRICWLFVFGVIHACLFWTGDVLHVYAIFGLVLLALRRVPEKLLWSLFAACLLYPVALGIYRLVHVTPDKVHHFITHAQALESTNNAAYGHGSFFAAAREHTHEMKLLYTYPPMLGSWIGFYVQVFTTMLLGLILGRRRFFQNIVEHLPLVRRLQWSALAVGIATGAFFGYWEATVETPAMPTPFSVLANVSFYLCRISTMTFYVATIVSAAQTETWRQRLRPIAMAGRMPLTNYLMQTLIATFIFYGWGLGFWGKAGPAMDLLLAVSIFFIVQVPLSRWWLGRFDLGPMEYVWRRLTYGRATLKSKVAADAATA